MPSATSGNAGAGPPPGQEAEASQSQMNASDDGDSVAATSGSKSEALCCEPSGSRQLHCFNPDCRGVRCPAGFRVACEFCCCNDLSLSLPECVSDGLCCDPPSPFGDGLPPTDIFFS